MIGIELTPLFVSDEAIKELFKLSNNHEFLLKLYCKFAKLSLRSGQFTKRSGKIQDVNRRFVITEDEYNALNAFIKVGMVVPTDLASVSEVGDAEFSIFWETYPERETNGHTVKIGKAEAFRVLQSCIATSVEFHDLFRAVQNYRSVTSPQYIKDAHRFLKVWRDYVDIAKVHKARTRDILDQKGYNALFGQ